MFSQRPGDPRGRHQKAYLGGRVLRAMEAGARAYIRKPFAVKDLSGKVEPLLADKLETAKT